MVKLTRAQRLALKRVYDRAPICINNNVTALPITYKQFRRGVQQGWGCVMIQWKGMWLGIEPDGYTHS